MHNVCHIFECIYVLNWSIPTLNIFCLLSLWFLSTVFLYLIKIWCGTMHEISTVVVSEEGKMYTSVPPWVERLFPQLETWWITHKNNLTIAPMLHSFFPYFITPPPPTTTTTKPFFTGWGRLHGSNRAIMSYCMECSHVCLVWGILLEDLKCWSFQGSCCASYRFILLNKKNGCEIGLASKFTN